MNNTTRWIKLGRAVDAEWNRTDSETRSVLRRIFGEAGIEPKMPIEDFNDLMSTR